MATAKKTTRKKPTAKQLKARQEFAVKAKKASKLVKSGKAKDMKSAWKKV